MEANRPAGAPRRESDPHLGTDEDPKGPSRRDQRRLETNRGKRYESQTDGEPLPELSEVAGEPGAYLEKLKQFASNRGIRLGYDKDLRADGVSRCGEIVLKAGLEPAVTFHVLAHEVSHEIIHEKDKRKDLSKRQAETEAEAVAFVVSRSIGLQTGNSSSDYIQIWQGDKETLSESLDVVQKTAAEITQAILN